ncbi:quercetin 2,3-dioxygenase [Micromonospora gifhornensis]|uniref:quercetin 2,3-dioxygenase n=1 Tax=Micromonospora gifhornensis TaxID=84594 RepID=UPI003655B8A4
MSFPFPVPDKNDPRWTARGGIFVRHSEGTHRWLAGDTYTIKVTADDTNGSLGFIEATVPPGAGPVAHSHGNEDEAFYVLSGRLEFLNGDELHVAEAGDFVFIPRGNRHRFTNVGDTDARMLVIFTPGGHEKFFVDNGDEPQPGEQPPQWGPERYAKLVDELIEQNVTILPE